MVTRSSGTEFPRNHLEESREGTSSKALTSNASVPNRPSETRNKIMVWTPHGPWSTSAGALRQDGFQIEGEATESGSNETRWGDSTTMPSR